MCAIVVRVNVLWDISVMIFDSGCFINKKGSERQKLGNYCKGKTAQECYALSQGHLHLRFQS